MPTETLLEMRERHAWETQQREMRNEVGLVLKTVGVFSGLALYWAIDQFSGSPWGRWEYGGAMALLYFAPQAMRWNDKRVKAEEIRDKRAIRIEAKLDGLNENK